MDGVPTNQTNKRTNIIAGLVAVSTAAMVGVSTNHHCRQLIVKKVGGGDTDHSLGTGFVMPSLPTSPPSRSVSAMMITHKKAG